MSRRRLDLAVRAVAAVLWLAAWREMVTHALAGRIGKAAVALVAVTWWGLLMTRPRTTR